MSKSYISHEAKQEFMKVKILFSKKRLVVFIRVEMFFYD